MSKIYIAANTNRILIEYLMGLSADPARSGKAYEICLVLPGGLESKTCKAVSSSDPEAESGNSAYSTGSPSSEVGNAAWQAVCMHPDIYMCKLGVSPAAPVFIGDAHKLGPVYPQDVRFCAAGIGKYLVCNTKHTSPALLNAAEEAGLTAVHVGQGYTKCNLATVSESAAITSDVGVYKVLRQKAPDIDVLLIRPGYISLPGFSYGFIGGASGRVGDEMIFSGNLAAHPDFEAIRSFVEEHGAKLKYFPEYELTDIGSIIEAP